MSGGFPAPSDGSIPASIINDVSQIRLTQWHFAMYATKYLEEISRGVAYGTQDSTFTTSDLLDISLANVESYAKEHIQCLQTLIANKNLLTASGTANSITLSTRVIDNSLENGDYAQNAPLPLSFRDGLELDFVAIANNTGAVTVSIPSFQGVSGALNIVKQDLTACIEGDIKTGYRYTIICDQANNRFILRESGVTLATQAQVNAGTSNNTTVTPLTLQTKLTNIQEITTIVSGSGVNIVGYTRYFNASGTLIKIKHFGRLNTILPDNGKNITFPIAFTNAIYYAVSQTVQNGANSDTIPDSPSFIRNLTLSGMRVSNADATDTIDVNYVVEGI